MVTNLMPAFHVRAAVSFEDRQDVLGHKSERITSRCSTAELLMEPANKVVGQGSRKSPALVMPFEFRCAPGEIRTPDHLVRSLDGK
jgi:hypothetical protein